MGRHTNNNPDAELLSGKRYSKSNDLINAKGTYSLLTQKLFAIGVQRLEVEEKTGILYSRFYPSELKKLLGKSGNSIYSQLKMLTSESNPRNSLDDWKIVIANDKEKKFRSIRVITDSSYDNGVLTIRYNNLLNDKIYQLKKDFTVYVLEDILTFRSQYSFRIYEILKADHDKQLARAKKKHAIPENRKFIKEIELDELKLQLGIIDSTTDKEFVDALNADNQGQKVASKGKYSIYSNFKVNVLDKAWKEIREKTHLMFDYEKIPGGKGGKAVAIRFYIWEKEDIPAEVPAPELSDEEKENVIDEIMALMQERLRLRDYKAIASAANYDLELVKKQYELMNKKRTPVNDVVAYMVNAVKNDFSAPVQKKGSNQITNSFNNFEQNKYDFDEFERLMLDN